jgi:hypothetical protein
MKHVRIDGEFPELKGNIYATGDGTGSTVRAAFSRAVDSLFKQPNLKRKRIHNSKFTVTINDVDTIKIVEIPPAV